MKATIETGEVYTILHPEEGANRFILNSPHSGDQFPDRFLARAQLSRETLRRASDLYVDRLIQPLAELGATVMHAHLPRSYVDLNREPFELDPRLISGPLPMEANTRTLRVAGGLGTVPRVIGDQIEIYAGKLSLDEIMARIEGGYLPYHRRLHQLLSLQRATFGEVVLIDMHSMPSTSAARRAGRLADIVLGDRFGSSCHPALSDAVEQVLRAAGFDIERNQPYAGGYITEYYGRPTVGWHALQLEINRSIYMNETTLLPNSGFFSLQKAIFSAFEQIIRFDPFETSRSGLQFFQKAAE
jgi:N-formylglutamate amidohydrolase